MQNPSNMGEGNVEYGRAPPINPQPIYVPPNQPMYTLPNQSQPNQPIYTAISAQPIPPQPAYSPYIPNIQVQNNDPTNIYVPAPAVNTPAPAAQAFVPANLMYTLPPAANPNHNPPAAAEYQPISAASSMFPTTTNATTTAAGSGYQTIPPPATASSTTRPAPGSGYQVMPPTASSSRPGPEPQQENTVYLLKPVIWNKDVVHIVQQNKNGPCAIIAIINALILMKKITINQNGSVTFDKLAQIISNEFFETSSTNPNYAQSVKDALDVLPETQKGLTVNVRFDTCTNFEYTKELAIFDLLALRLVHGWIADPANAEEYAVVSKMGFNQLSTLAFEQTREGQLAKNFLQNWQSQLTYKGLFMLHETLKDGEIAILFRNDHFSTVYKHKDQLLMLLTDQGFRSADLVWEVLANIHNDSTFLDGNFETNQPKPAYNAFNATSYSSEPQYVPAPAPVPVGSASVQVTATAPEPPGPDTTNDLVIARFLQEEEDARAENVVPVQTVQSTPRTARQQPQPQPQPPQPQPQPQPQPRQISTPPPGSHCIIL